MLSTIHAWWLASRPKTLSASVAPVAVGTALAAAAEANLGVSVLRIDVALAALMSAVSIQIGTNLSNDVLDFKRGADNEGRLGPLRVTQAGLLAPRTVALGAAVAFVLAVANGLYVVTQAGATGGPPLLALGVAAIISGLAYTMGPWPLAYVGLGDLFVLLFFGIAAVAGTYFAQVHASTVALAASIGLGWMDRAVVLGVSVGALAVAILAVNNLRDLSGDAVVGKRTLAVRMGDERTRVYYLALVAASIAIPVLMAAVGALGPAVLVVLAAIPLAIEPIRLIRGGAGGRDLNPVLAATARLQMAHAALLSLGLGLDAMLMGALTG